MDLVPCFARDGVWNVKLLRLDLSHPFKCSFFNTPKRSFWLLNKTATANRLLLSDKSIINRATVAKEMSDLGVAEKLEVEKVVARIETWNSSCMFSLFSLLLGLQMRRILAHSRHFCPTSDAGLLAPSQASGRISFMLLSAQLLAQRTRFAPNSGIALRKEKLPYKIDVHQCGGKLRKWLLHTVSMHVYLQTNCGAMCSGPRVCCTCGNEKYFFMSSSRVMFFCRHFNK